MKPRVGFALIPIVVTDSNGERRDAYVEVPLRQHDGRVFIMLPPWAEIIMPQLLPIVNMVGEPAKVDDL